MCGIAGFQFGPRFSPSESYKTLLTCFLAAGMDRRGGDSFGTARLTETGEIRIWKGLGKAIGKLKLEQIAKSKQLILHTRKRTHGAINIPNAHPLQHGHILGTHNGMVSNHDDLNKKYSREFDLDSRHIFEHLSKGLDVSEIGVYGAISYIDLNDPNVINLCKLSRAGDLEVFGIGTSPKDVKGIVYASTAEPIVAAMEALGETAFKYETIPAQRRYYIRDGELFIDKSKGGELPFGEHPFREYQTSAQTTGTQIGFGPRNWARAATTNNNWEPPEGMKKLCKRCRRKKKHLGAEFNGSVLCQPCWQNYMTALDKLGTSMRSRYYGYCEVCLNAQDKRYVSAVISKEGHSFCAKHAIEWAEEKEEKKPLRPYLLKPGGPSSEVVPAELDQWDLCNWCTDEIKRSPNAGWNRGQLCTGCKKNFEDMISSLKELDKYVRDYFAPVLLCSQCHKIPTFGWLKTQAFLDDGHPIATCHRCRTQSRGCSVCHKKETTMIYCAAKESLTPYCKECWKDRNAKKEGALHAVSGKGN